MMNHVNQDDKYISVNTLMIGIDTLIACFMENKEKLTKPISDASVIALQMVKEFVDRTLVDPNGAVGYAVSDLGNQSACSDTISRDFALEQVDLAIEETTDESRIDMLNHFKAFLAALPCYKGIYKRRDVFDET